MKQIPRHHGGMELEPPTRLAVGDLVLKAGPVSMQSPLEPVPTGQVAGDTGTRKPLDTDVWTVSSTCLAVSAHYPLPTFTRLLSRERKAVFSDSREGFPFSHAENKKEKQAESSGKRIIT